jgi:serine protease AprX
VFVLKTNNGIASEQKNNNVQLEIKDSTKIRISSFGATGDVENIEPGHLPYYTTMSGTSMVAPHLAGIVALLLEANPRLSPTEVKDILQKTASNMSGYETWEVGAGYANANAAVDAAFSNRAYGTTVNANRSFTANVNLNVKRTPFTINYSNLNLNGNTYTFDVEQGLTEITARINATGLLGQTGNTINLVLVDPDGNEYNSGIY